MERAAPVKPVLGQSLVVVVCSGALSRVAVTEGWFSVRNLFSLLKPPRWPSGKASASRAEGPGFESRLRRDLFGVESYQ